MNLEELKDRPAGLDRSRPTVVYCAGGFRSTIAASRLMDEGFADDSVLLGGLGSVQTTNNSIAT